jgi:hypothetical protein
VVSGRSSAAGRLEVVQLLGPVLKVSMGVGGMGLRFGCSGRAAAR